MPFQRLRSGFVDVKKSVEEDAGLRQVKICNIFGISEKKTVMGSVGKHPLSEFGFWVSCKPG